MSHAESLRQTYTSYRAGNITIDDLLTQAGPVIGPVIRRTISSMPTLSAEDIESRVLTYLWQHPDKCHTDIVAWLRRIAYNMALREIQAERKRQQRVEYVDAYAESPAPATEESYPSLPATLRPDERRIAHLLSDGASYSQISDELGISTATISHRVADMRKKFAEI